LADPWAGRVKQLRGLTRERQTRGAAMSYSEEPVCCGPLDCDAV